MPNMSLKKNEMPVQDPNVRNKNFKEVALGYTEEQAVDEANRCLHCPKKPCQSGCPVSINIPEFIAKIKERDFEGAYQVIHQSSSLPAVCGRVCPQETQCESKCVRGIKGEPVAIGRLERFVADWHNAHATEAPAVPAPNGHKVAIIGAGPSGLTCAGDLAKLGYDVTVFEALHLAGGVLVYGIPEFRLPKSIVQHEVDNLVAMGVKVNTNVVVGRTIEVDELFEQGFEAIFIGSGAGLPRFMNIPGENFKGVYSANEFLTRVNLMKAYKPESDTPIKKNTSVAVVGGGNVAMDCSRSAVRMTDGKVHVIYRRTEAQAPADPLEIKAAKEEGIEFHFLTAQKELVLENGKVTGLRCIKLREGAPEANGRRKLIEIPGTEFVIPCSNVISAIGQRIDQSIFEQKDNILFDKRGNISVTESLATSRPGVFAGGDCATGPTTLIGGMAQGQTAAESIHEYLTRGSVGFEPRSRMTQMIKKCNLLEETEPVLPTIHQDRQQMPELAPEIRAHNFEEVESD